MHRMLSLWRNIEGTALVEAALLTPILIVLFFGVFEFSWYFYNQQLVEIGVRDAARYLARGPNITPEGTNICDNATLIRQAQNLATTGTIDGSGSARVNGWIWSNVSITCPPFDNSSRNYVGGDVIYRVTVTTSFADPALGYFGLLRLLTPNLSASHSERSIGPG